MSEIQRLDDQHLVLIQPLFQQVFQHSISLELLSWKYAAGRGESWVLLHGTDPGEIAFHCGLIFRDILLAGEPVRAAQLVDLMAGPKVSGLSRGQSPFHLVMQHLLDSLPRPENPAGVAFGFPSARAMRLGEHLGVYRAVDQWFELKFTARKVRGFQPKAYEMTDFGAAQAAMVNRLWQSMADDLHNDCVAVRNAEFLRQRYVQHPHQQYVILQVRHFWQRQTFGLAVVKTSGDVWELMDVIGTQQDIPAILRAVQDWLIQSSGKSLVFLLTGRFAETLKPHADSCDVTEFRIMANPNTPDPVLTKLTDHWWLTGGDTDYR